jgi:hypothetical protein
MFVCEIIMENVMFRFDYNVVSCGNNDEGQCDVTPGLIVKINQENYIVKNIFRYLIL